MIGAFALCLSSGLGAFEGERSLEQGLGGEQRQAVGQRLGRAEGQLLELELVVGLEWLQELELELGDRLEQVYQLGKVLAEPLGMAQVYRQ